MFYTELKFKRNLTEPKYLQPNKETVKGHFSEIKNENIGFNTIKRHQPHTKIPV